MKKVLHAFCPSNNVENLVVLTHAKSDGWKIISSDHSAQILKNSNNVLYLGKCDLDGDMFAVYTGEGYISIFKGFLNSGMYK